MNSVTLEIDSLIPHRRPMRLVDHILEVGEGAATTGATVTTSWPLLRGSAVSPFVLIELAAQTAGICIGHQEKIKTDGNPEGMGWLVGVKRARFYLEALPIGAHVVVRTTRRFVFERLTEVDAAAFVDGAQAGEVVLQIMRSASSE
jgi:predicted hotdog family 3-hydroxylacyl-ACP dehydratase